MVALGHPCPPRHLYIHVHWVEHKHLCRLAPKSWKEKHEDQTASSKEVVVDEEKSKVGTKKQRSTWAKLIKKVYGVDPLICPMCHSEMRSALQGKDNCNHHESC